MEEYGKGWCIRNYTMMAGVLAKFGPNSRTILPVWPTFPPDAVWMASFTPRFAAVIA